MTGDQKIACRHCERLNTPGLMVCPRCFHQPEKPKGECTCRMCKQKRREPPLLKELRAARGECYRDQCALLAFEQLILMHGPDVTDEDLDMMARHCYRAADAMLRVRNIQSKTKE